MASVRPVPARSQGETLDCAIPPKVTVPSALRRKLSGGPSGGIEMAKSDPVIEFESSAVRIIRLCDGASAG
jgi:hypothetical protein